MKPACVVLSHKAGLFSNLNKVITCLDLYEHVEVDWSKGDPHFYGFDGKSNLWDALFDPTEKVSEPYDTWITYPDLWLTSTFVANQYNNGQEWRHRLNELWRRIRIRPHIQQRIDDFLSNLPGPFVSTLVRSDQHQWEQTTQHSQPLEEYEGAARALLSKDEPLYLACENEESIQWFRQRLPRVVVFESSRRSANRSQQFHSDFPQTVDDAINCLIEVVILSKARAFIHPVSNMATAALYMNPGLKSVYLP